jgi:DNA modification methylase
LTPWLQDPDVTLYHGDALAVLRELTDESVHCIATSPPFYGLRDYGVDGQIGLEETPEQWASRLVEVFREARRVLRKDGTLWVECGDSYAANSRGASGGTDAYTSAETKSGAPGHVPNSRSAAQQSPIKHPTKPKDLLGQPWLLAFALRADGWWLRGCNIWAKPNAMPESAKDRCTTAHSYVFHFAKSARYFFDGDAISEPAAWERWGDQTVPKYEGTATSTGWMEPRSRDELIAIGNRKTNGQKPRTDERRGFDNRLERADGMKHPRSVWTIPTQGFPEAHFATWPEALARKIILAACPEDGTTLDPFCGSGTTLYVARKLGRRGIGIDLNDEYLAFAARRLQQLSLFAVET